MSDYLVERPPGGWTDFAGLAEVCGVQLTHENAKLGGFLVGRNELPEPRPYYVSVHEFCAPYSVGQLLENPFLDWGVPVHPMVLIVLAAGMYDDSVRDSIWTHMQYTMGISPFLLTHEDGSNYVFVLKHDRKRFSGEFLSLRNGDYLPRCVHIWGYPDPKKPTGLMFRKGSNGKYGHYVS